LFLMALKNKFGQAAWKLREVRFGEKMCRLHVIAKTGKSINSLNP